MVLRGKAYGQTPAFRAWKLSSERGEFDEDEFKNDMEKLDPEPGYQSVGG